MALKRNLSENQALRDCHSTFRVECELGSLFHRLLSTRPQVDNVVHRKNRHDLKNSLIIHIEKTKEINV